MDKSSFRILLYILSECDTMHIGIPKLQILILKWHCNQRRLPAVVAIYNDLNIVLQLFFLPKMHKNEFAIPLQKEAITVVHDRFWW